MAPPSVPSMCARLSYSPDPFLDGASEKVASAGAPLLGLECVMTKAGSQGEVVAAVLSKQQLLASRRLEKGNFLERTKKEVEVEEEEEGAFWQASKEGPHTTDHTTAESRTGQAKANEAAKPQETSVTRQSLSCLKKRERRNLRSRTLWRRRHLLADWSLD